MTYNNLQHDIATWAQEAFGAGTEQVVTKLETEFAELVEEISIKGPDADGITTVHVPDDIAGEAADVLFMLFQLAENFEFDLLEETQRKFEVNKQRTWEPQPDGTYQHVKVDHDEKRQA